MRVSWFISRSFKNNRKVLHRRYIRKHLAVFRIPRNLNIDIHFALTKKGESILVLRTKKIILHKRYVYYILTGNVEITFR